MTDRQTERERKSSAKGNEFSFVNKEMWKRRVLGSACPRSFSKLRNITDRLDLAVVGWLPVGPESRDRAPDPPQLADTLHVGHTRHYQRT